MQCYGDQGIRHHRPVLVALLLEEVLFRRGLLLESPASVGSFLKRGSQAGCGLGDDLVDEFILTCGGEGFDLSLKLGVDVGPVELGIRAGTLCLGPEGPPLRKELSGNGLFRQTLGHTVLHDLRGLDRCTLLNHDLNACMAWLQPHVGKAPACCTVLQQHHGRLAITADNITMTNSSIIPNEITGGDDDDDLF